jgi:D-2-hydroxyacid dehydrogenase (NADP+)
MELDVLGIDESVSAVFPTEALTVELADLPVETVVVDGSPESLADCQEVVTLEHREAFVHLDWVHSIQSGADRFPADQFREAGTVLTSSNGIHGDAVGETVVGYVLALARRLHDHATWPPSAAESGPSPTETPAGRWPESEPASSGSGRWGRGSSTGSRGSD